MQTCCQHVSQLLASDRFVSNAQLLLVATAVKCSIVACVKCSAVACVFAGIVQCVMVSASMGMGVGQ